MIPGTLPAPSRGADSDRGRVRTPPPLPTRAAGVGRHLLVAAGGRSTSLRAPIGRGGVIVGMAGAGRAPLVVRLFQPRPVVVAAVGTVQIGQILALRSLAVGAQVVVVSGRPEQWDAMSQAVAWGDALVVAGLQEHVPTEEAGSRPVLEVTDAGATPSRSADRRPWKASMVLLPYLTDQVGPLLRSADLVVSQRLSLPEAELLATARRLGSQVEDLLPRLPDEVTLWHGHSLTAVAHVAPTPLEVELFGSLAHGRRNRDR